MRELFAEFSSELGNMKKLLFAVFYVLISVIFVAWVLSGFTRVRYGETALKLRFGKVVGPALSAGVHYSLPFPIGKIVKLNTGEVKRLLTGFGAEAEDIAVVKAEMSRTGQIYNEMLMIPYCITGDKNIVHVKVVLQYRITDPEIYLYKTTDPVELLGYMMQNAILESIAAVNIDRILTTDKLILQNKIMDKVKMKLELQPIGISIVSVEVARVRPPSFVEAAFRDVTDAREEQITKVHEADSYAKNTVHLARTEAAYILENAEAYAVRKKAYADGESERFNELVAEYNMNRDITSSRLWLEALGEILPKMKIYIIGSSEGEDVAAVRLLSSASGEK